MNLSAELQKVYNEGRRAGLNEAYNTVSELHGFEQKKLNLTNDTRRPRSIRPPKACCTGRRL